MGLAVVVAEKDTDETIRILEKDSDATVKVVGAIKKGHGVEVPKLGLTYC
jgi:hypothetical protein